MPLGSLSTSFLERSWATKPEMVPERIFWRCGHGPETTGIAGTRTLVALRGERAATPGMANLTLRSPAPGRAPTGEAPGPSGGGVVRLPAPLLVLRTRGGFLRMPLSSLLSSVGSELAELSGESDSVVEPLDCESDVVLESVDSSEL